MSSGSRRIRRPRARLHPIAPELEGILGGRQLARLTALARLRGAWAEIVGPMMAAHSEPDTLESRDEGGVCLWIAVDHPVYAQQIRLLRDDIRKACFRVAGLARLTHVRTRVRFGAGAAPAKPAAAASPRPVPLATRKALARELRAVKDRQLRHAMFRARLAQLAYDEHADPPGEAG